MRHITLCSLTVTLAFSAALLRAADFDHYLRPTLDTVVLGYYSADTKPVLTIKSGERVKIDTISLFGIPDDPEPFYRENNIPLDNPAVQDIIAMKAEGKKRGVTLKGPLTGPIAIEEAEPGDMLEVRVLSLKMGPVSG